VGPSPVSGAGRFRCPCIWVRRNTFLPASQDRSSPSIRRTAGQHLAEGYDAVGRARSGAPKAGIVKRLALSRRYLVAAPAYGRSAATTDADELKRHRAIVYSPPRRAGGLAFQTSGSGPVRPDTRSAGQ